MAQKTNTQMDFTDQMVVRSSNLNTETVAQLKAPIKNGFFNSL